MPSVGFEPAIPVTKRPRPTPYTLRPPAVSINRTSLIFNQILGRTFYEIVSSTQKNNEHERNKYYPETNDSILKIYVQHT
jgi:hypothetical protein